MLDMIFNGQAMLNFMRAVEQAIFWVKAVADRSLPEEENGTTFSNISLLITGGQALLGNWIVQYRQHRVNAVGVGLHKREYYGSAATGPTLRRISIYMFLLCEPGYRR